MQIAFLNEMNQHSFQLLQTHGLKINANILLDIHMYTHLSDSHVHSFDPLNANEENSPSC